METHKTCTCLYRLMKSPRNLDQCGRGPRFGNSTLVRLTRHASRVKNQCTMSRSNNAD